MRRGFSYSCQQESEDDFHVIGLFQGVEMLENPRHWREMHSCISHLLPKMTRIFQTAVQADKVPTYHMATFRTSF